MWPDRVSNPGPLTYKSGALPTALRGPSQYQDTRYKNLYYEFSAHIGAHIFVGFVVVLRPR